MIKLLGWLAVSLAGASSLAAETIRLDQLDIAKTEQDWKSAAANVSVEGHPLTIGGKTFEHGVGTHAVSILYVQVNGATHFSASVGLDSEVTNPQGSVEFFVYGDGKVLWQSGVMRKDDAAKAVDVDLAGVKILLLKVGDAEDGNSYDHADWAEARFEFSGTPPVTWDSPPETAEILTPAAPLSPRINGPAIFGVRPGHPFFYHIPVTGERPMKITVAGLPHGLQVDAESGVITGQLDMPGEFTVTLKARNARGKASRKFKIVAGDMIALTPPMGWNSWNCFAQAVDDGKIRTAASAIVNSGLINHGWAYVNIDDCWEGGRDADGMIQSNEKFPDMHALGEFVHGKGLKFGIYSSPGPKTCGGFMASWQHEEQDARQYAAWGVDYLKYDWCSYSEVQETNLPDRARFMKPYQVMDAALQKTGRDILFSLCQYGMGDVWEWGAQVGGNCWRTTGDIRDSWGSMSGIGFGQNGHEKFAGPGHWNDPDMLVLGRLGWGSLRPTHLTPNEQYTHVSLWCLLSAPLLIGSDLSQLDAFTINLLSNDEVLAVDQDALGRQASRISKEGDTEVWAKDMADGSKVVGLFNRQEAPATVAAKWSDLGLTGKHRARDLWRQKDMGKVKGEISATVPRHGVLLVRVW